jgi:hypothetical protein
MINSGHRSSLRGLAAISSASSLLEVSASVSILVILPGLRRHIRTRADEVTENVASGLRFVTIAHISGSHFLARGLERRGLLPTSLVVVFGVTYCILSASGHMPTLWLELLESLPWIDAAVALCLSISDVVRGHGRGWSYQVFVGHVVGSVWSHYLVPGWVAFLFLCNVTLVVSDNSSAFERGLFVLLMAIGHGLYSWMQTGLDGVGLSAYLLEDVVDAMMMASPLPALEAEQPLPDHVLREGSSLQENLGFWAAFSPIALGFLMWAIYLVSGGWLRPDFLQRL